MKLNLSTGLFALMQFAAVATAATALSANQPECKWQVVTAKRNSAVDNLLEGGPINELVALAGRPGPYRNFVCANPEVDWSSYGRVEITSVEVAPGNLKKPLSERQSQRLKDAFTKSLSRQFDQSKDASDSGRTLKIKATITEVRRTSAALNIVSWAAIQMPVSFGGATTLFELSDGVDGTKIADITLRSKGKVFDILPSVTTLGDSRQVLNRAPKQVSKDIDFLRKTFGPVSNAGTRTATPAGLAAGQP